MTISPAAIGLIAAIFKTVVDLVKPAKQELQEQWIKFDLSNASSNYLKKIDKLHNSMKIIGMDKPIRLTNIFTQVNILSNIPSRQRRSIREMEELYKKDSQKFGDDPRSGTDVVKEEEKLIVLGKPGAGKTTFLKYLTIQAATNSLYKDDDYKIPVFIGLKEWSDQKITLMDFIVKKFDVCNFPDAKPFIERVLANGKCLLLLDGFDEVSSAEEDRVVREINDFVDKYSDNRFVLSCRTAGYHYCFEQFTEVEMANFNQNQIKVFVQQWFGKDKDLAEKCLQEINTNPSIKDLATTPLLLTLLCLNFRATMSFPPNRAVVYKKAIELLLDTWDSSRKIDRGKRFAEIVAIYKDLYVARKEMMFSVIAIKTFQADEYFIHQQKLETYIADYIKNLSSIKEKDLELNSKAVLKAIEAQHGIFVERAEEIYSFSHLTFQEYFTAKYIVDNQTKGTLKQLVDNYILEDRWREVFLLTAGLLPEADDFLLQIKQKVEGLVDEKIAILLGFLKKLKEKYRDEYSRIASSKFNFEVLFLQFDLDLDLYLDRDLARDLARALDLARDLDRARALDLDLYRALDLDRALDRAALDLALALALALDLDHAASDLEKELIRTAIKILSIDKGKLYQYLFATKRLYECLSTDCYIQKETRALIEDSILSVPDEWKTKVELALFQDENES